MHKPSKVGNGLTCRDEKEQECDKEKKKTTEKQPNHSILRWHTIPFVVIGWIMDVGVSHAHPTKNKITKKIAQDSGPLCYCLVFTLQG